jgi:hypothetical protein
MLLAWLRWLQAATGAIQEVKHLPQRNLAVEMFSPDDPHPAAPPSPAPASEGIRVLVRRILRKYGYSAAR